MRPQLREGTYGIFPRDLCEGLPPAEQLVLTWLWSYKNNNRDANANGVWPSIKTIMRHTGYKTEETIRAALRGLEKRGLLLIEARKRDDGSQCSNNYILYTASVEECTRGDPLINTTPHPLKNTRGDPLINGGPLTIQYRTKQKEETPLPPEGKDPGFSLVPETDTFHAAYKIVERYNAAAEQAGFPQCTKVTPEIKSKIRARLKDHPLPINWEPIWAAVVDMGALLKLPGGKEDMAWFNFKYIIRSADTFDKVAGNWMAWRKKQTKAQRPSNSYHEDADSPMRQAVKRRTVKFLPDGTMVHPYANV